MREIHRENRREPAPGVQVELGLSGSILEARFRITDCKPHANPAFPKDRPQWNLWDWDVVELFVSVASVADQANLPYYEFQVSPLNQFFELEILEPRERVNDGFRSGFHHAAKATASAWEARMGIPLEKLGWNGDSQTIRGNAFAILGTPGSKSFHSLFLPRQDKPDFHIPKYFQELINTQAPRVAASRQSR